MNEQRAQEFLEKNIELIENGEWEDFFTNFWDDSRFHVSHEVGQLIIDTLRSANIEFDEELRKKLVVEGANSVIQNEYGPDANINIRVDLYAYDAGWYTDGPTSWLGYTADEFVDILFANRDKLDLEYSPQSREFARVTI